MTIFFISDTHFSHANFLKFTDDAGNLIRPFASVEEMNERMIEGWNSVVRDGDKVYHLGDVTFRYDKEFREIMSRLRGRKRLLLGNHDLIKGTHLLDFFEKVSLWRVFKDENFVCSHIPLRSDQMRMAQFNVHGHTHQNVVSGVPYINVCVERVNYTPVALEEIKSMVERRTKLWLSD